MPWTGRPPRPSPRRLTTLALALGGAGARRLPGRRLRAIARRHPQLRLPILTGISAGAVNTTFLAAQAAPLPEATEQLVRLWLSLTPDQSRCARASY
jgi:NTE family protein